MVVKTFLHGNIKLCEQLMSYQIVFQMKFKKGYEVWWCLLSYYNGYKC